MVEHTSIKWLQNLSRIDRLESGLFGDCEPSSDGVHELRIHISKGYRVYFGNEGGNIILLLKGGEKNAKKRHQNGIGEME